jgi:hypothetical protein
LRSGGDAGSPAPPPESLERFSRAASEVRAWLVTTPQV